MASGPHVEYRTRERLPAALIVCLLPLICGCVVRRGVDFGHWARPGEQIDTVRIFGPAEEDRLSGNERILLLPPMGKMTRKNMDAIRVSLYHAMRHRFPAEISYAKKDGRLAEYLAEDNLLLFDGTFNFQESGRLGRLLGASHVLCVRVCKLRPYPPQVLSLRFALVETESCQAVAEMSAIFDASEQQVVTQLGDYMQSRRARKFNQQNLDIMLRSPSEYTAFVMDRCLYAFADKVWNKKKLMITTRGVDKKKGM